MKKLTAVVAFAGLGLFAAGSGDAPSTEMKLRPERPAEWSSTPTPIPGQGVCWTEHKANGDDEYLCTGETTTVPDSFEANDAADPNRQKQGYVQAEDGSWVSKSFYGDTDEDPVTVDTVHDGRYAPCGVVTEDGVTEYLNEYEKRCG